MTESQVWVLIGLVAVSLFSAIGISALYLHAISRRLDRMEATLDQHTLELRLDRRMQEQIWGELGANPNDD